MMTDEFAERLIDAAEEISPLKDGCPNRPNCGHLGYLHDIEDDDDPLPMCGIAGCLCGRPPEGWWRVPEQIVILPGGIVPAGIDALGLDGVVHLAADRAGGMWVNETDGPLVEVERARNAGEAQVAAGVGDG